MKSVFKPKIAAAILAASCVVISGNAIAQEAADCNTYTQAAQAGKERAQKEISRQAAATKEALDAAKACLKRIDDAMAMLIPGFSINLDFSGIIAGMINKACNVVTSKIDEQGRLINGTASDISNRVIGGINDTVGAGIANGGTTRPPTGPGGAQPQGPGVTPSGNGMGGNATVPPPANPAGPRPATTAACKLLGIGC